MIAADDPTVFVVDNDAGVRASIQGQPKSARLRCTSFGTVERTSAAPRREDAEKRRMVSSF
jgi:hypothetical protein